MAAAEKLPVQFEQDKVSEEQMAVLLGTTAGALQTKRSRKQIPEGVWNKINNRIIYSRRRYDEWLESLWVCPLESKFEVMRSGSASPGMASAEARHSPIPRRRKGSKQPAVYVIK